MDTERYQALMDTIGQIKARAEELQSDLREGRLSMDVTRFQLDRVRKLSYAVEDQVAELFRAEEEAWRIADALEQSNKAAEVFLARRQGGI